MGLGYGRLHPYRFEDLARKLADRTTALKTALLSGAEEEREFSGMTDSEFSDRLETYNQVGWIRDLWATVGRKIIDATDYVSAASQGPGPLPVLPEGEAVYIHFSDADASETTADGVYLAPGVLSGVRGHLFTIVGSFDPEASIETIGDLLIQQSNASSGFAPRGVWTGNLDITGALPLCSGSVVLSSLSRASVILSLYLESGGENLFPGVRSVPPRHSRH